MAEKRVVKETVRKLMTLDELHDFVTQAMIDGTPGSAEVYVETNVTINWNKTGLKKVWVDW